MRALIILMLAATLSGCAWAMVDGKTGKVFVCDVTVKCK